ncbi:MAG: alpha/beta hydrolase [Flavobacteriaceae bacterium]
MIFQYGQKQLYYEIHGKGPVLVLLHGFLESSTIWEAFIEPLSGNYTLLLIDFPGHGKSHPMAETQTMELMAEVVHELLDYLKYKEVILMGHSMGGYVALAFTEFFEDIVSKLILLNSTSVADSLERKENRNRAIALLEKEKKAFLSMAIAALFSEDSRAKFTKEIKILQQEANGFPSEGIIALIKGMRDREDRTPVLNSFPREKWILCGKKDPLILLSDSRSIAEQSGATLEVLPGSHMGWLENRAEIVKILLLIDKNCI